MATPPLPSRGPKRGRTCYTTPAFYGIANAYSGEQNKKWLPHPCILRGPKEGGNATSPLHSRGSPTPRAGSKMRTRPQQRGTKSKVATSPVPSRRPKTGPKCYVTPAFQAQEATSEVVPNKGGEKTELVASPLPSLGRKRYVTSAFSGIPNAKRGEQNKKWLPHPCLLGGPKQGRNATSPLHSRGSPRPSTGSKIRTRPQQRGTKSPSLYLTLAFSAAQNRAKMLHHPCILRDPQCQARKATSEVVQNKGEQNQKWLPHPCLLWGGNGYATPAFSGIPNAKRGEQRKK